MRPAALAALAAGLLTLRPREGAELPPAPVWASARPSAEELLVPPPEAAPARIDDVIRRPERAREDDPFDPPPR
jgi:hypothetical protein